MDEYILKDYKTNDEKELFDTNLKQVFENHYFSNHYQFAISLEEKLFDFSKMKNNITYMNSSIALISLLKIIDPNEESNVSLGKGTALFLFIQSSIDYIGLKSINTGVNNLANINIILDIEELLTSSIEDFDLDRTIIIPTGLYTKEKFKHFPHIFDLDHETVYGLDTGSFIALNNNVYADKLRWMKSSYARTGNNIEVSVQGNGRFSEIQASEALAAIESKAVFFSTLKNFNHDVYLLIEGKNNIKFYSSDLTTGIFEISNNDELDIDNDLLNKLRYEKINNVIYIKLPFSILIVKKIVSYIA